MLVRAVVRTGHATFAILLEPLGATGAVLARIDHAADAHDLSDLEMGDVRTGLGDAADDLVARNAGIDCSRPLATGGVQVGVADAAEEDVDAHVPRAGVTALEGERTKGRVGAWGGVTGGGDHD